MTTVEEQAAQLKAEFGIIRDRIRALVNEALATLTLIEGLAPERLDELRDALFHADHPFLLVFVGPFSAGKSSLINALLQQNAAGAAQEGQGPLDIGPIPTTDRIAILHWGPESERLREGEVLDAVYYPAPLLQRVSLVDTPGLGSVFQAQEEATRRFLHRSDTVFWVMMARQALLAENLDALRVLREFGKKTIILLNQADLLDEAQRQTVREYVLEQSQERLGWRPPVWLVSAKEGLAARSCSSLWQSSGLQRLLEYIEGQLGDRARLQQKLNTSLQILQLASKEAQETIAANQARWDRLGRAVENLERQAESARAQADEALDAAHGQIITTCAQSAETVAAAWRLNFAWRALPSLLARALLDLLGLGWIPRRTRGAADQLATGWLSAVEDLPAAAEQLAKRQEARDWQDLGDLVSAAEATVDALPQDARAQLVGEIALPNRYDRGALEGARRTLRELAIAARQQEEAHLSRAAEVLVNGVVAGLLLLSLLAIGAWFGRPLLAEWRPDGPLLVFATLGALAGSFLLWLPLSARWNLNRFFRRWEAMQARACQLLAEAARAQMNYGLQLRRDAILPLSRLWQSQSAQQAEQRTSLNTIQQELAEIEGALLRFGRTPLRERLGLARLDRPLAKEEAEESLADEAANDSPEANTNEMENGRPERSG